MLKYGDRSFGKEYTNSISFDLSHYGYLSIGRQQLAALALALELADVAIPSELLTSLLQTVLWVERARSFTPLFET